MTDTSIPRCKICGGKLRFQRLVKGYVVAGCEREGCLAEYRFSTAGSKGPYATFVNSPEEFMRRFTRTPEGADTAECWPILPGEAETVSKACQELHITVADLCGAASTVRQASEELARLRLDRDVMRKLAGEILNDLICGVDMEVPEDKLRLEIFGNRLRQLAGMTD